MSIFGKIKDAIFGHKTAPAPEDRPQIPAGWDGGASTGTATTTATAPSTETGPVDGEEVREAKMVEIGNPDLKWRTSIVDLMKLLGLDSSLDNRNALATELGYTGQKDGSVEMNLWLHKEVMRQLAANGGTVPGSLTS
jgi:hypothetical protein